MICIFGTVCLDRIRQVSRIPLPGQYVDVESETLALGGEAANTASHLARWDVHAELVGNALAGDVDGVLLEGYLAEHGLRYETRSAPTDSTPVCDVYVTPDGERTMFGMGFGTMAAPPAHDFLPTPGGLFTCDGNFGAAGEAYADRAKQGGMRLYLMDVPADSPVLCAGAIWQTSTRWAGKRGDRDGNAALVAEVVARTGCTAILTDAANGLVVGGADGVKLYPAFPRPKVRDSTGAGDILRAGVLYGLEHRWGLGDALAFGAAAAALAADHVGAAEGPSRREVEDHLAAHPDVAGAYR